MGSDMVPGDAINYLERFGDVVVREADADAEHDYKICSMVNPAHLTTMDPDRADALAADLDDALKWIDNR